MIRVGDRVRIIGLIAGQQDLRDSILLATEVDDPMLPNAHVTLAFPDRPGWFVRYPLTHVQKEAG